MGPWFLVGPISTTVSDVFLNTQIHVPATITSLHPVSIKPLGWQAECWTEHPAIPNVLWVNDAGWLYPDRYCTLVMDTHTVRGVSTLSGRVVTVSPC